MTAFVLDASVTAAWLLPDEASDATRRLYAAIRRDQAEPQVPDLWHWECTNILANGVRRQRIPADSIDGLWNVLEALRHRVRLHTLEPAQHKASLEVALDAGMSAYDAGYVWLALSLGIPLATFDSKLVKLAPACGVELLDLAEV